MAKRRKRNPGLSTALPWIIGAVAVGGVGYVVYQQSQANANASANAGGGAATTPAATPAASGGSNAGSIASAAATTATSYADCIANGGDALSCAGLS
jgi:uncharacterized membrane protein YebE (DUF533 family)